MFYLALWWTITTTAQAESFLVSISPKAPTLTKIEATKILLNDSQAYIVRCSEVQLNDKLSIVNKKK